MECDVHSLNKYYLNNNELENKNLFNSHVIKRIFLNQGIKSHYVKLYNIYNGLIHQIFILIILIAYLRLV